MKIRILSDLHLEFSVGNMLVPELPDDSETVLVLAGDIGLAKRPTTYKYFIEDMAPRFKHIIYVLGNHEFYKGNFPTVYGKIWNELLDYDNVEVLEKESFVLDGVAFVGATLWSDMNKHDPNCIYQCQDGLGPMNDYVCVRTGPSSEPWKRKLRVIDTMADHFNAKHFVFEEIKKQKENGNKVVVVTHMSPCSLSISDEFTGDPRNGAYYSDLSEQVLDTKPEVWIHGHMHNSSDYTLGDTRIICNPRGYDTGKAVDRNADFDSSFTITL